MKLSCTPLGYGVENLSANNCTVHTARLLLLLLIFSTVACKNDPKDVGPLDPEEKESSATKARLPKLLEDYCIHIEQICERLALHLGEKQRDLFNQKIEDLLQRYYDNGIDGEDEKFRSMYEGILFEVREVVDNHRVSDAVELWIDGEYFGNYWRTTGIIRVERDKRDTAIRKKFEKILYDIIGSHGVHAIAPRLVTVFCDSSGRRMPFRVTRNPGDEEPTIRAEPQVPIYPPSTYRSPTPTQLSPAELQQLHDDDAKRRILEEENEKKAKEELKKNPTKRGWRKFWQKKQVYKGSATECFQT